MKKWYVVSFLLGIASPFVVSLLANFDEVKALFLAIAKNLPGLDAPFSYSQIFAFFLRILISSLVSLPIFIIFMWIIPERAEIKTSSISRVLFFFAYFSFYWERV